VALTKVMVSVEKAADEQGGKVGSLGG